MSGFFYCEWSVEGDLEDLDLDDRRLWYQGNPSLGITRANGTGLSEDYIANVERGSMTDEDFARERLGVWRDVEDGESSIIADNWPHCLVGPESQVPDFVWPSTPAAITFDIPPDRSSGSIGSGAPAPAGNRMCVDVLDHGPGTGWMVDRLVELNRAHPRAVFACDAAGPAGSLLDPLHKAGLKRVKAMSLREHQQACGGFFDGVAEHTVAHLGRPELDEAVQGAVQRIVGDSWMWSRKGSSVDISPLVAVTLAHREGRVRKSLNIDNYRK